MFKALKEKLGNVLSKFTKDVEQEEEIIEEEVVEKPAKKLADSKKKEVKEKVKQTTVKEEIDVLEEVDEIKEDKGFFSKLKEKITTTTLSEEKFEDLFWDLEIMLMENNMAQEVIDKIKQDLKETLTSKRVQRSSTKKIIEETLQNSLREILSVPKIDLDAKIKSKKPFIISMIGVNGSGKTTSLAKLIHLLQKKYSVVVAASDTFRAAAIQQLEEHTTKLGVKLIKHDYKSDPSAVAFDAIKHAESKGIDIVLIDTAGRLHSNDNLMNELKKLDRVCKPDIKIFVGESITGNDCTEQARIYNEMIGIDGIILSKVDVDEKGGAAISISKVTGKPIMFIGTGQTYGDLEEFDPEKVLDSLGLN